MAIADTAALIASLELQDKFSSTLSKYDKGIANAQRKTSTLEQVGFQTGRGLRNTADNLKKVGLVAGGIAVAGIIKSINAASDLNESLSKSQVVFGDSAAAIEAWSKTSAESFGLSQQAALETAGTFGNLFTAMGIGDKASTEMSTSLVELAADLASFNNLDTADVLEKLRAGIVGEAEPLRTLGVQISAARTEAKALELGFKKVDGEFTASQKAMANYQIILEDTKKAQGDFARTSDGLANSQRILRANLDNTFALIGGKLTPVVAKLTSRLNDLLKANQPAIAKFADSLPAAFDQLVSIVERLPWQAIGSSLQLAGKGAQALLTAFTSMPDWVQTAVLTGWGLNKLTGGALGNIAGTLTGALAKGIFGQLRGSTPATPVFTKEVGIPGTGGAPIGGGGGRLGGILGLAGLIALPVTAGLALADFVRTIEDVDAKIGHNLLDQFNPPTTRPASSTPIGQFVPANAGGTRPPGGVGGGADIAITQGIKTMHQKIVAALERGDVEEARNLKQIVDGLRGLDNRDEKRNNLIVAHIGRTNNALSTANRKLETGNARQRELKVGIDNARSSLQTGFSRTNANLGVANARLSRIAEKDFSPNVQVTVPVTNNVSISEVTRTATSTAFASGFTPQLLNG